MVNCYPCTAKVKLLASGIGTKGDPIGCCRVCHVLACGHHAHRDASVPEYICVECDPNLLAASAGAMAPPDNPIADELASYYLFGPAGRINERWHLFRSLDDFWVRRPRYGEQLIGKIQNLHLSSAPWEVQDARAKAALELPSESQALLVAAIVISEIYRLDSSPKLLKEIEHLLPSGWRWE